MVVGLGCWWKLGRPSRLAVAVAAVAVAVAVESIEEWIDNKRIRELDAIDCHRLLSFCMDFEEEDERLL